MGQPDYGRDATIVVVQTQRVPGRSGRNDGLVTLNSTKMLNNSESMDDVGIDVEVVRYEWAFHQTIDAERNSSRPGDYRASVA